MRRRENPRRNRSWLVLLAALLAALGMTACRSTGSAPSFDRTYQDYKDGEQLATYVGENEDGTDGMLLYAPGVVQLTAENGQNQVVEADHAARRYVLEAPSAALLALQPGDVFVMLPNPGCPEGITAKVETIVPSGSRVTVTGGEVALGDLFEYVNLDMAMPLSAFAYDASELEEGVEVILTGNQAASAPEVKLLSAGDADTSGRISPLVEGTRSFNTGIVLKRNVSVALGNDASPVDTSWRYDGSHVLAIKTVHVEFKFSAKDAYLYSGLWFDYETGWDGAVKFEGSWNSDTLIRAWPRLSAFIPHTPIAVYVTANLEVSLSGSMDGKLSQGESRTTGFTCELTERGSAPVKYDTLNGKHANVSMNLEGTAEATVGIEGGIEIPFVAGAYVEARAGAQAVGTLDLLEAGSETNADQIHDCRKCIDGDVNLVFQLNSGLQATLLQTIANKKLEWNWFEGENAMKIGDFYASYRDESGAQVELGAGECPYLRYRVDISVRMPSGDRAGFARVKAVYPDQRTEEVTMDAGGEGVLYLPSGNNVLSASLTGYRGKLQAAVEDRPASAAIRLEEVESQVYIVYGLEYTNSYGPGITYTDNSVYYDDISAYPELNSVFLELFPDAVFVNGGKEAWNYAFNVPALEELCGNELNPGDIVILAEAGKDEPWDACGEEYYYISPTPNWSQLTSDYIWWPDEAVVFNHMSLRVFVALGVTPEQAEQYRFLGTQDDVVLCNMYLATRWYNAIRGRCPHASEPHTCYYPVEREWIDEQGFIVTAGGVLFDADYRVTGREDVVTYDWDQNTDSGLSHALFLDIYKDPAVPDALAQRVRDIYPYVQLLQDGDYIEKVGELTGAKSPVPGAG